MFDIRACTMTAFSRQVKLGDRLRSSSYQEVFSLGISYPYFTVTRQIGGTMTIASLVALTTKASFLDFSPIEMVI